jgi:hypothetical protein
MAAYKLLLYSVVIYINISRRTVFNAQISFKLKERYIITFEFIIINIVKN